MATFNFNAAQVTPTATRSYDPLPAGEYETIITKSDIKATKSGTGHYLELEMQIISGEHSGRRHWERLNVDNQNKQAEEIAKAALASLCYACGIEDMTDTEQLHDHPFVARIEVDRKDPTRNRVMGYVNVGGVKAAPAAPAPVKPAAPAAGRKPWE